jgi:copper chaperone CopZ
MKHFVGLLILTVVVSFVNAQSAKKYNSKLDGPFTTTKTFRVDGVCEMCKHTIEGALKRSPAVYFADWDEDSKLLLVKYNRTMVDSKKLEELVAASGHSTQHVKADTNAVNGLPECCKHEKRS